MKHVNIDDYPFSNVDFVRARNWVDLTHMKIKMNIPWEGACTLKHDVHVTFKWDHGFDINIIQFVKQAHCAYLTYKELHERAVAMEYQARLDYTGIS